MLPPDDEATAQALVEDFRRRHRGGVAAEDFSGRILARLRGLAAGYLRYSCDNSNPRSLDDQLDNVLGLAHRLEMFVPWDLVFAHASVSGMDPSRQGYRSLKRAVEDQPKLEAILIDEFTRASRDTLEWFRLSFAARRLAKNVLGATDGFDLNSPMGQMMLHVFGMFSTFFISKLREAVRRGMRGAAGRGTALGRPPLGYALVPVLDQLGRPVPGKQGKPLTEKRIHPPTMKYVRLAVDMLVNGRRTPGQIAKEFSRLKVDGSDRWTDTSIRRVLHNPIYYGIEIHNRTRNEWDPETGKRMVIQNPRKEWIINDRPHLRAWTKEQYLAVRRILYKARCGSKLAGRPRPCRKDAYPKTPVEADLFCQCGSRINRVRGGDDAALGCFNGQQGTKGCTMNTVKALRIAQEAVLGWVRQHVLTEAAVERLVDWANAVRAEEANRPKENTAPLRADLAELTRQHDQLVSLLTAAGKDHQYLQGIVAQVAALAKQMSELSQRIREAQRRDDPPPPPLRRDDVVLHLEDLHRLLDEEPAVAAAALSRITGKITVGHERYPHRRRGGKWVLSFTPSLLPLLDERLSAISAEGAAGRGGGTAGSPESRSAAATKATLAFAAERGGGNALRGVEPTPPVHLVVDKRMSVHERLVPLVARYVGRIHPATGKPYTATQVAAEIGHTKDVVYLTWRLVRGGPKRRMSRRRLPSSAGRMPPAAAIEPAAA